MLSENEKDARKRFYAETGKTPEQEAADSAAGLGYMFLGWGAVAVAAGLFYLLH